MAMEVTLSQRGKPCNVSVRLDSYDGMAELSRALAHRESNEGTANLDERVEASSHVHVMAHTSTIVSTLCSFQRAQIKIVSTLRARKIARAHCCSCPPWLVPTVARVHLACAHHGSGPPRPVPSMGRASAHAYPGSCLLWLVPALARHGRPGPPCPPWPSPWPPWSFVFSLTRSLNTIVSTIR